MREFVFFGVTFFGSLGDGRAARIGETEDFGDFVENFADGVIVGCADNFEVVVVLHEDNLRVPTRYDESDEGEFGILAAREPVGVDMGFQMMNGIKGLVVENSKGAGSKSADKEGAKKSRGVSYSDGVDILNFEVGLREGLIDNGEDCFDVRTSGDFGNDAAIGLVNVDLRDDDIR